MKKLFLALFLFIPHFLIGQTDTTITSIVRVTPDGKLYYRTAYAEKDSVMTLTRSDIYRYDFSTGKDSLFLEDYFYAPPPPMDLKFQNIASLIFVKNNPDKFAYLSLNFCTEQCGTIITGNSETPVDWFVLSDSGGELFTNGVTGDVYFYTNNNLFRSSDGGETWPEFSDSNAVKLSFTPLALAPDSNFFMIGFDNNSQLVGTRDTGRTVFMMETSQIWNYKTKIYFNEANLNYYAIAYNNQSDTYELYRRKNDSPAEFMEKVFASNVPIKFAINNRSSEKISYAVYNQLYTSADSGRTFTKTFTLPHSPRDIFYYDNRIGILYLNKIALFENNQFVDLIKKDISSTLSLMPLSVGNYWKYHYHSEDGITDPNPSDYDVFFEITGDTVINGKRYFTTHSDWGDYSPFNYKFLRVDSLEGKIYGINSYGSDEELALDLLADNNDDLSLPQLGDYIFASRDYSFLFGEYRLRMTYFVSSLYVAKQQFAGGIGINYRLAAFDFGSSTLELLGCVIDGVLYGDTTTVSVDEEKLQPEKFYLSQNYPNPFNPTTVIKYSVPSLETPPTSRGASQPNLASQRVSLKIYDILGRVVAAPVNEKQSPGNYEVKFNAENLSSGIYIYRLKINDGFKTMTQTRKMVLLK